MTPFAIIVFLLCLTGFVLSLVATISVPVTQDVYLFNIRTAVQGSASNLKAGILGLCGNLLTTGSGSTVRPTSRTICSSAQLGYSLIASIQASGAPVSRSSLRVIASADFTRALIFNPFTTAFAGMSAILVAFMLGSKFKRGPSIATFVFLGAATLCGWIAWALELAIIVRTQSAVNALKRVAGTGESVHLDIGATMPLALIAVVALSTALIMLAIRYRQTGREREMDSLTRNAANGRKESMVSTATAPSTAPFRSRG